MVRDKLQAEIATLVYDHYCIEALVDKNGKENLRKWCMLEAGMTLMHVEHYISHQDELMSLLRDL